MSQARSRSLQTYSCRERSSEERLEEKTTLQRDSTSKEQVYGRGVSN